MDLTAGDPACRLAAPPSIHGGSFQWTSSVLYAAPPTKSIGIDANIGLDRAIHVGGSDDFNVVFIGAGNIMFGPFPQEPLSIA